jgi:allantoate deiminase
MTAAEIIGFCRALAISPDARTFLSPAMRAAHREVQALMERTGMSVRLDAAGNLRGLLPGADSARRLVVGSHIDTVPNAGAFDGVLGVVLGIALAADRSFDRAFDLEVIAFSDEEGVRFGVPFIGSRAVCGTLDQPLLDMKDAAGISVAQAIREFGLDPADLASAVLDPRVFAYLEFHIEQGPVLESLDIPLGIVEAIAGQTRMEFRFQGAANHAGTTPMHLRRDALAGAAEWIGEVERDARNTPGLVATVGRIEARPGAGNVIAGEVVCSLDVRHARDGIRALSVQKIQSHAGRIASLRGLTLQCTTLLEQPAVPLNPQLTAALTHAAADAGYPAHRMVSGAGHDAMIVAARVPAAMLFLRSPGGISHSPEETVLPGDVEAALQTGLRFLRRL